jgi:hypothetical protein
LNECWLPGLQNWLHQMLDGRWWGEIHLSGTSRAGRAGEVFVSQLLTWICESSRRRPQMLTRFVWRRRSHQRHLLILGRSNLGWHLFFAFLQAGHELSLRPPCYDPSHLPQPHRVIIGSAG